MRKVQIKHERLAKLLKEAREEKDLCLSDAALILGFSSKSHLSKVESGTTAFPADKLRRAADLYDLRLKDIVEMAVDDYRDSVRRYLRDSAEK